MSTDPDAVLSAYLATNKTTRMTPETSDARFWLARREAQRIKERDKQRQRMPADPVADIRDQDDKWTAWKGM